MKTLILAAIRCSLMFLVPSVTYAISAQWDLDPVSGDWNTAANWTPGGPPNGPSDTATFALSNTTNVFFTAPNTEVEGIVFTPDATSPYTITVGSGPSHLTFTLSGTGITNNSGITQNFVTAGGVVTNVVGGHVDFFDNSSAGSSTTFTNNGGTVSGAGGGQTEFADTSTAANGTFTNNGATVTGGFGGVTSFSGDSHAANGTFTNNGGTAPDAQGGLTIFGGTSHADSATLIATGGINGGQGGTILFTEGSSGSELSRVEVSGNGNLDISPHNGPIPSVRLGFIEGDGNVFLGANALIVGSQEPLATTFSGVIQDGGLGGGTGGSLIKVGTGSTLTLSGANTYTGDTNINGGVLKVNGSITSNTFVDSVGTLAGTGTIQGNLTATVGTVSPGDPIGTLTVGGNYTQEQFATLMVQIAGASPDQFSVLNVLGNADLNGTLEPVLLNGFIPEVGQTFAFLFYDSLAGEFSGIANPNFDNMHWSITYGDTMAILTAEGGPAPIPDQGSTFLLLTLSLLGLVTYQRQLLRGQP